MGSLRNTALSVIFFVLAVQPTSPVVLYKGKYFFNPTISFSCFFSFTDPKACEEKLAQKVTVGQSATFLCKLDSPKGVPYITVNSTSYYWSRLPFDYDLKIGHEMHQLDIPVAKLWMNNTVFGCYDDSSVIPIGCLHVTFGE